MTEICDFINKFEPLDVPRIAFAWNGKHGADLKDSNLDFRRAVVNEVLANPNGASVQLLCALVDVETAFAKEAWGTSLWVHNLAEQMLIKGGPGVVSDFLTFWYRGMDAHCELSRVSIPAEVARRCEAFCSENLATATSDRERVLYNEGARFFGALIKASKEKSG